MKTCAGCKQLKDLKHFHKLYTVAVEIMHTHDGYQAFCNECIEKVKQGALVSQLEDTAE